MLDVSLLKGLGVALASPFLPAGPGDDPLLGSGGLDLGAWRTLIRHVGDGGADFLVVLGSTGEGPTVLAEERASLIAMAKREARGLPVVVGCGHNSTREAARLAAEAAEAGADALLVVTPYYNKPQASGLLLHYAAVAKAGGLPIIAYNVPGRTGLNLLPRDLDLLWTIPEVVAIKESSGNLAQIGEICRRLPEGKILLAGDDGLALPSLTVGASGLISVIGNLLPAETKALVDAGLAGRRAEAAALHAELLPIMDALFLESNPSPLKAALELAGICSSVTRLPLMPASAATRARLAELSRAWHFPKTGAA